MTHYRKQTCYVTEVADTDTLNVLEAENHTRKAYGKSGLENIADESQHRALCPVVAEHIGESCVAASFGAYILAEKCFRYYNRRIYTSENISHSAYRQKSRDKHVRRIIKLKAYVRKPILK